MKDSYWHYFETRKETEQRYIGVVPELKGTRALEFIVKSEGYKRHLGRVSKIFEHLRRVENIPWNLWAWVLLLDMYTNKSLRFPEFQALGTGRWQAHDGEAWKAATIEAICTLLGIDSVTWSWGVVVLESDSLNWLQFETNWILPVQAKLTKGILPKHYEDRVKDLLEDRIYNTISCERRQYKNKLNVVRGIGTDTKTLIELYEYWTAE